MSTKTSHRRAHARALRRRPPATGVPLSLFVPTRTAQVPTPRSIAR